LNQPVECWCPNVIVRNIPVTGTLFAQHPTLGEEPVATCLCLRKDGSEVRSKSVLIQFRHPKARFVLAIIIDITERKRSEQTFRQVIEHAPYGKLLVDKEVWITLVNMQIEKFFGYDRGRIARSVD